MTQLDIIRLAFELVHLLLTNQIEEAVKLAEKFENKNRKMHRLYNETLGHVHRGFYFLYFNFFQEKDNRRETLEKPMCWAHYLKLYRRIILLPTS